MTTTKSQKDKLYSPMPRLTPRPTAASAARAARNATNRNLALPTSQRQSPTRTASPVTSRIKTAVSRNGSKCDSKSEMKINRNNENEFQATEIEISPAQELETSFTREMEFSTNQEKPQDNNTCSTYESNGQEIHHADILVIPEITNENITYDVANVEPAPIEKKRPPTPNLSRPQTPRSVSSRPQTPRFPPRPSAPCSRPNTPQRSTPPTRTRTPSTQVSAPPRPVTPVTVQPQRSAVKDEELKSTFITKQKEFHRMKRELDLKQQAVLEVYEGLSDIRSRMSVDRVPEERDLVLFNVADWAPEEVSQLCRDAAASSITDGAVELFNTTVPIDECALAELETRALSIPGYFTDLCLQAFQARQELIDWIKELFQNNEICDGEVMDRIACYSNQGLQLADTLYDLKSKADDAVYTVTLLSKRACRERSTLVAVGESLVREVARLRQDLEARTAAVEEIREIRIDAEATKALEEVRRDLEEERFAKTAIKDKLANAESQLRQTRLRVSKMDRQLRESEASIASLTGTVKSLEDQSRQREVHLEARARKLKESLKTGEVASSHLAQQRDAIQTEANQLKEQVQTITAQHKTEIQELNSKIKDLKSSLEENKNTSQSHFEAKNQLQVLLDESKQQNEELKNKITELENNKPNPDLPTEREMDLWAELQATKDTLRISEEEIAACKREKMRFLETLSKIAESDDKVGMQQKLSAELLSKEEILAKMQTQIRELTKNIKHNEQKVIQYEQYVRDIQAHNRAVANCQEAPNGISYEDLQQEIMNLKMNLLEAVHHNDELSEVLAQKEQLLEHQDKTSRGQARIIKIREELINMLKNKETEQSRHLAALEQDLEHRMRVVDEVNKQIAAKADEIQELFGTLETKQQQIHRLEKIVLALEEQQRRAQAQRTRHEEKIAALEHELLASGARRERKFLFF